MKYLIILIMGLTIFSACEKKETHIYKKYEGPLLVGYNIFTNYTDSGKVKLRMWAPEQQELETGDRVFPKGIKIDFYEKGKVSSVLTANQATFSKVTGIYTVRNKVEIKSNDNKKMLKTEELKWFPQTHKVKIEKDQFVQIQDQNEILTGWGLDANDDFRSYRITKPKGIFAVKN